MVWIVPGKQSAVSYFRRPTAANALVAGASSGCRRPYHHARGRADGPLRRGRLARGVSVRERAVHRIGDVRAEPNQHDQGDEGCAHGGRRSGSARAPAEVVSTRFRLELPDRHAPDPTQLVPAASASLESHPVQLDALHLVAGNRQRTAVLHPQHSVVRVHPE